MNDTGALFSPLRNVFLLPYLRLTWQQRLVSVFISVLAIGGISPLALGFAPIPAVDLPVPELHVTQPAIANEPFTVTGRQAGIFGLQNGSWEAWIYPYKILRDVQLSATLEQYGPPLDLHQLASTIVVTPSWTVITHSHIAFRIQQVLFVPSNIPAAIVLFKITSSRPLTLSLQFVPEMQPMWPGAAPLPSPEWVPDHSAILLHTEGAAHVGLVGWTTSQAAPFQPFQEITTASPQLELSLVYDPTQHADFIFPLIILMNQDGKDQALHLLETLRNAIPQELQRRYQAYQDLLATRLRIETPDPRMNEALQWAMIALEQSRVRYQDEEALIAGYHLSGRTTRPGFAWFFGRDMLWSVPALLDIGDLKTARQVLKFLMHRQRHDGKMMHEWSQSSHLVRWAKDYPYFYAAADATPLFLIAMDEYLRASGDLQFLTDSWQAVAAAYAYARTHDADGDGLYENTGSGHGWVESGPLSHAHQEFYLASLWTAALQAVIHMANAIGQVEMVSEAEQALTKARSALSMYWGGPSRCWAFAKTRSGQFNWVPTIFPAVALWHDLLPRDRTACLLDQWASAEFSTDWGLRPIRRSHPLYDPISYHHGSVWPLFTGWVALAEYRAHRPVNGFMHLWQNAELTFHHNPGKITELLSGEFFRPFPRSSSHQLWSSAMVVTPMIRGLLGLSGDALRHQLTLAPALPAHWDTVTVRHYRFGTHQVAFTLHKDAHRYRITVHHKGDTPLALRFLPVLPFGSQSLAAQLDHLPVDLNSSLTIPPEGSISLTYTFSPGVEIRPPLLSSFVTGQRSTGLRFIRAQFHKSTLRLALEGHSGRAYEVSLLTSLPLVSWTGVQNVRDQGGEWKTFVIDFPQDPRRGYVRKDVVLGFEATPHQ